MRVNMSLDNDLVKKIDAAAAKLFISRSAFISMACSEKMQSKELLDSFVLTAHELEAQRLEKNQNEGKKEPKKNGSK